MKRYWSMITAGIALTAMVAPNAWALIIAIQNTQGLAFGSFVAGSGGSVTIGTSGVRSASGGVLLIPSSVSLPAQFTVTGDADATYTIQLPSNDFVKLTGPGADMVINDFTGSPSGAGGQLSAGGSQTLSVGGTLNVSSDQVPGAYAGTFSVIVNYN